MLFCVILNETNGASERATKYALKPWVQLGLMISSMKSEVLSLGDNRAGDLARGGVDCNSTGGCTTMNERRHAHGLEEPVRPTDV